MTVIAYRKGIMAADSRCSDGPYVDSDTDKKIFRLSDGSLLGLSGNLVNGLALLARLKEAIKKPGQKNLPPGPFKNVEAILVRGKQLFFYGKGWETLHRAYVAI